MGGRWEKAGKLDVREASIQVCSSQLHPEIHLEAGADIWTLAWRARLPPSFPGKRGKGGRAWEEREAKKCNWWLNLQKRVKPHHTHLHPAIHHRLPIPHTKSTDFMPRFYANRKASRLARLRQSTFPCMCFFLSAKITHRHLPTPPGSLHLEIISQHLKGWGWSVTH